MYLGPKRFRLLPLPLSRGGEPHSADPLVLLVSCFDPHQTIRSMGRRFRVSVVRSIPIRSASTESGLGAEAMEHGEDGELTGRSPEGASARS